MTSSKPSLDASGKVIGKPFVVPTDWIDHNRHVNLARYADAFYLAARQLSEYLEMTTEFKERTGTASFAAELCISYKKEVAAASELRVESQLLGYDTKRVHAWHELYMADDATPAATGEMLGLNIDRNARRVADMPDELLNRLAELADRQQGLSVPGGVRLNLGQS